MFRGGAKSSRVLLRAIAGALVLGAGAYQMARDAWADHRFERAWARGERDARADARQGRLVAKSSTDAFWGREGCAPRPVGFPDNEQVALQLKAELLERDPERAWSCVVNEWRNCVMRHALRDRYDISSDFPVAQHVFIPVSEAEEAYSQSYDGEMWAAVRARLGGRLDSLRQAVLVGRLDYTACSSERSEMEGVGAQLQSRGVVP